MTLQRARAPPGRQNGLCGLAHFPTPPSPPTLSTHAQRGRAGRRMRRPHPFPTVRRAGVRCGLRLRGKERPCSWPPPGCPARWQACFACVPRPPPPQHTHTAAPPTSGAPGAEDRQVPARVRRVGPLSPPTPPRGGPSFGEGEPSWWWAARPGWSWVVKTPPPRHARAPRRPPCGPSGANPHHAQPRRVRSWWGARRGGGGGGETEQGAIRLFCESNHCTQFF